MPSLPVPYCLTVGCNNRRPCSQHPDRRNRSTGPPRIRGHAGQKRRRIQLSRHPICQRCNLRVAEEVDHIIPLSQGGPDTQRNLQSLCLDCHQQKTRNERQAKRGGRGFHLA